MSKFTIEPDEPKRRKAVFSFVLRRLAMFATVLLSSSAAYNLGVYKATPRCSVTGGSIDIPANHTVRIGIGEPVLVSDVTFRRTPNKGFRIDGINIECHGDEEDRGVDRSRFVAVQVNGPRVVDIPDN